MYHDISTSIQYQQLRVFKLFMDHSKKINLSLPLGFLFCYSLQWENEDCAVLVLQQRYYPTQVSSKISQFEHSCFYMATKYGFISLMSLLVELNPHFLQEEWFVEKYFPSGTTEQKNLISRLVENRKQPASLTKLCKCTLLAQLEAYHHHKIDALPLPKTLKMFLKEV